MAFRFSRRVRILPGVRLNVSKGGVTTSIGGRGAWLTLGRRRTRTTIGLPGTGLSYTQTSSPTAKSSGSGWVWITIVAIAVLVGLVHALQS